MSINISYLSEGSRLIDSYGNKYILVAQNHYGQGQSTLWMEKCVEYMPCSPTQTGFSNYENSDVNRYLRDRFPQMVPEALRDYTLTTSIPYTDLVSKSITEFKTIDTKYFLFSSREMGDLAYEEPHKVIPYLTNSFNRKAEEIYWTRTETYNYNISVLVCITAHGEYGYVYRPDKDFGVRPAFNVSHDLMVEDKPNNGYYKIIEIARPKVGKIPNLNGNYGSATTINYTVTNTTGLPLTHHFSKDNGLTWELIKPTQNGNNYYFNYVFNEIKNYYCKIKIVDSSGAYGESNMFTVFLEHSVPNINILGHDNLTFRFKATCATSEISKIEIYINDKLEDTLTTNLDFTQTYSINKALLTKSKNAILVKATSKANSVGSKGLEVIKVSYDLPAVGSKVIINDNVYTVLSATKIGDNMILTLKEELVEKVLKGDVISILQDNINVKCSLSNIENDLNYKDMTLVKVKTLKGDFEGYIEEKYVLEGEGRYSSIKLELERFSEDVNVEVAELQQMFDYLED